MPRKALRLNDLGDLKEVAAYIEDHARRSESLEIKKLLCKLPDPIHAPYLRPGTTFNILTHGHRAAATTHVRGQVQKEVCSSCRNGNGPFVDCVVIDGHDELTKMCCTNCQWTRHTTKLTNICSFTEGRRKPSAVQKPEPSRKAEPIFRVASSLTHKPKNSKNYKISALWDGPRTHILGQLFLPSIEEQPKYLRDAVMPLLSDLKALHDRDMTTLRRSVNDSNIDQLFENFKQEESRSWKSYNLDVPSLDFLVKPSGLLSSPLSQRLNQPSFTTDFPENGFTADPSNGCTRMVMDSIPGKVFIYDQMHRRDDKSHGCTRYPPFVRASHWNWTQQLSESLEAKVEIVYGKKAMQSLVKDPKIKMTVLPLWGEFFGITAYLVHETSFANAQGYKFRRVVLSAHHPQRLFYEPENGPFVSYQQKIIAAAAAMAGVDIVPRYYIDRLWYRAGPSRKWLQIERILRKRQTQKSIIDHALRSPTMSTEDVLALSTISDDGNFSPYVASTGDSLGTALGTWTYNEDSEKDSSWEALFDPLPHSNKELLKILPGALEEAQDENLEWSDPHSLPESTLKWWKGQKCILFYDSVLSELKDIVVVLERCLQASSIPHLGKCITRTSFRQVLLGLMMLQDHGLRSRRASQSAIAGLAYYKFDGEAVAIVCSECRADAGTISNGMFSINRPNHLIVNQRINCSSCQAKMRPHPVYISRLIYCASSLQSKGHYSKLSFMIRARQTLTPAQMVVESFCIYCRYETRVKDGKSKHVDYFPQWTLGYNRSLYLERRIDCLSCKDQNKSSGRFIPIDENIPSIMARSLYNLIDTFGQFGRSTIALILDQYPSARRTSHSKNRGGAVLEESTTVQPTYLSQIPGFQTHSSTMTVSEETTKNTVTSVVSCPICGNELAGLSDVEASMHVNNCLDGNASSTSIKNENQDEENKMVLIDTKESQRAAISYPAQVNPFTLSAYGNALRESKVPSKRKRT